MCALVAPELVTIVKTRFTNVQLANYTVRYGSTDDPLIVKA